MYKSIDQIITEAHNGLVEPGDLKKLLTLVYNDVAPKNILEIGVRQGFTFRACVDYWQPEIAIGIDLLYKGQIPAPGIIPIVENAHYLWGMDSQKQETVDEVKKILDGKLLDFLFIDGDHSLVGVTKDWENYSPLVREGGIIAFHDVLSLIQTTELIEVKLLFDELSKTHKTLIINEAPKTDEKLAFSSGMGILFK